MLEIPACGCVLFPVFIYFYIPFFFLFLYFLLKGSDFFSHLKGKLENKTAEMYIDFFHLPLLFFLFFVVYIYLLIMINLLLLSGCLGCWALRRFVRLDSRWLIVCAVSLLASLRRCLMELRAVAARRPVVGACSAGSAPDEHPRSPGFIEWQFSRVALGSIVELVVETSRVPVSLGPSLFSSFLFSSFLFFSFLLPLSFSFVSLRFFFSFGCVSFI